MARTDVRVCPLVREDDKPNEPPKGYDTIRFGNSSSDHKGMLDKFCALERAYYFISIAIMWVSPAAPSPASSETR